MSRSIVRQMFGDYRRRISPTPHRPDPASWSDERLTLAWLGHATVLINFFGVHILTDPVFLARVGLRFGPLTIGPKRYVDCAMAPSELPRIDLVLLSHAHMDHLDVKSLSKIPRDCTVVTAEHTADIFKHLKFREVHELGWSRDVQIGPQGREVHISAYGLRHWGARMQWDTHRLYNAFVVERNGKRICFCGDTARTPAHALGSRGAVDVMLAPIGAYHPWIDNHCTPEEAVEMADEAQARFIVPIHHETFRLSWESLDEPIQRFKRALEGQESRIALTQIGETFVLPE